MSKRNLSILLGVILVITLSLVEPLNYQQKDTVRFFDRTGEPLGVLSADGGVLSDWVKLKELGPLIPRVVVALEDKRFWIHPGIDPIAIARAISSNFHAHYVVSGGSTITQQLAKHLLLSENKKRNYSQKLKEALLAVYLESRYFKKTILEHYLNRVYYGALIRGIGAAAQTYFHKQPQDLNVREIVLLSIWARSPVEAHQDYALGKLDKTIDLILLNLKTRKVISAEEYEFALRYPLAVYEPKDLDILAPHFILALYQQGVRGVVKTTLCGDLQRAAEVIMLEEIGKLQKKNIYNGAAVILDNATGEILAYVGTADLSDKKHGGEIDGVISPRQPGSALKPFLYYLAIQGKFTPATLLPDIRMAFKSGDGVYIPRNYDEQYKGPMSLRKALGNSLNISAVFVLSQIGVGKFVELLKTVGLDTIKRSPEYYGLGLTLGNAEVRLLDLAKAYAALGNQGRGFEQVKYLLEEKTENKKILDSATGAVITDILQDNSAREMAFGEDNVLCFDFPVAAKTGTTLDFRDNWAMGYTPEVTVGVWVGNHDQTSMHNSSGITGAGPIFHKLMVKAMEHRAYKEFTIPADVLKAKVCIDTGFLAGQKCNSLAEELFLPRNMPTQICAEHKGKFLKEKALPAYYQDWVRKYGLDLAVVDKENNRDILVTGNYSFRITFPLNGSVLAFDPGMNAQFQKLPLRTDAKDGVKVSWYINNEYVGRASGQKPYYWQLSRGEYEIKAVAGKTVKISKIIVY